MSGSAVLYGKHPAFGDFLAHGLPHERLMPLDAWLEGMLPELKSSLDSRWEEVWTHAPPLRFWLGPEILGVPLLGLFIASRDKVGRRFPLMFGLGGWMTAPPTQEGHDPALWEALWTHVSAFQMPDGAPQGAESLLAGFLPPDLRGAVPWDADQGSTLWAHRRDGDLNRLFADARGVDGACAQYGRSHWWHPDWDGCAAGWLATRGLPGASEMKWLLAERATVTPATEGEAHHVGL